MSDDLDVLSDSRVRMVEAAGETFRVRPLVLDQFRPFKDAIRPVLGRLPDLESMWTEGTSEADLVTAFIDSDLSLLRQAVAVAICDRQAWMEDRADAEIKRVEKQLGQADAAEFLELVTAVIAVNLDFFAHRLAPKIAALSKIGRGAGLTPSRPSSAPDTP